MNTQSTQIGLVSQSEQSGYITVLKTNKGLYQVRKQYVGLYRTLVKMAFKQADYQTLKVSELIRTVLQTDVNASANDLLSLLESEEAKILDAASDYFGSEVYYRRGWHAQSKHLRKIAEIKEFAARRRLHLIRMAIEEVLFSIYPFPTEKTYQIPEFYKNQQA